MIAQLFKSQVYTFTSDSDDGISKLVNLIIAFSETWKGWHVQFNVVDAKTLREAQKKPEQYEI